MGGNEIATLMASPKGSKHETEVVQHVRGWMLESPFFGFPAGEEPSALKISLGRLAGRFLPTFQLKHKIPTEYLSRDKEIVAALKEDKLCHDTGTLEGFAGLLDRVNDIMQGRVKPGPAVKSVWLGHGDADRCTSFEASKKWFDNSATDVPDRTFRNYEGWVHQLHGEPQADRQVFFREFADWILERSGGEQKEVPVVAAAAPVPAAAPADAPAAEATPVAAEPEAAPAAEAAATESKL